MLLQLQLVTSTLRRSGAAVGIRTPNLLIRSQMLYPIELRLLFSKEEVRIYSIIDEMENNFFTYAFKRAVFKKEKAIY